MSLFNSQLIDLTEVSFSKDGCKNVRGSTLQSLGVHLYPFVGPGPGTPRGPQGSSRESPADT